MEDKEYAAMLNKYSKNSTIANGKNNNRLNAKRHNYITGNDLNRITTTLGKEQPFNYYAPSTQQQRQSRQQPKQKLAQVLMDAPDAVIDLHKTELMQLPAKLNSFLARLDNTEKPMSLGLIITGKGIHSESGATTLKSTIASVLPKVSNVVALTTANQCDGGAGAFYLLWKN